MSETALFLVKVFKFCIEVGNHWGMALALTQVLDQAEASLQLAEVVSLQNWLTTLLFFSKN